MAITLPCWPQRQELPILLAVLLYYTGENAITMTALPYITYGVCRDLFPNATVDFCLHVNEHPDEALAVQDSALYLMGEKMLNTIPPLLLSTFFGPWSDVHGRKLPFLLPYLGNIVSVIFFLLAHYLQDAPVVTFVMAGFLARAICGHFILLHFISFSCVADLVQNNRCYEEIGAAYRQEPGWRSRLLANRNCQVILQRRKTDVSGEDFHVQQKFMVCMARLQVAESVGTILGSLLGWLCQKGWGAPLSFMVGGGILLLGMLVVICWMEFRNLSTYRKTIVEDASTLKKFLKKMEEMISCKSLDIDPVVLWGCLLTMFFMFACREGRSVITIPFTQRPPLSWPNARLSVYVASYNAFQSIFLFTIAPLMRDYTVVVFCLVLSTAGGVWLAFSTCTWSMILAGCFSHMLDGVFPALRAILCRHLTQNQVGKVLSKMSVAEALATLAGPVVFVTLYNNTADYFAGLSFLTSAGIPATILLVGALVETFYGSMHYETDNESELPGLGPRDASQRPDFTQSLNIPSATIPGFAFMWRSAHW